MSAVIQRTTAVGAGLVNENLLTGSAFEFVRQRSIVQIAVLSDDVDSHVTLQIGPQVIAEEFTPKQGSDFPVIPDDFYYAAGALSGDRIVVRARNSDAAATINFWVIVQITEV